MMLPTVCTLCMHGMVFSMIMFTNEVYYSLEPYRYAIPTCPCNHHSLNSSLPKCPAEGKISTPTCDFGKKFGKKIGHPTRLQTYCTS